MPNSLLSNLKIGNKEPYWLNVPYFDSFTANGTTAVNWRCTTDINLETVGTQIIVRAPANLQGTTTFNGIPIVCNAGGLAVNCYKQNSLLHLCLAEFIGATETVKKWVILN